LASQASNGAKPALSVGERGVAGALTHGQGCVEFGFADVDADDVHGASELLTGPASCQPHL
jgi:hypothetical protein